MAPQASSTLKPISDLDALLLPVYDFERVFESDAVAGKYHHSQLDLDHSTSRQFRGNNNTSLFFAEKFGGAVLEREPIAISDLISWFETETKHLPKFSEKQLPTLPEPSLVVPRTEQDVVNMFNEQVKPYIMSLARRSFMHTSEATARYQWIPNPSTFKDLSISTLNWCLEFVAEAFSKPRKEPGQDSPQSSVRVDQIFVLSATTDPHRRMTRRKKKLVEAERSQTSDNHDFETENGYLPVGKLWTVEEVTKQMKHEIPELLKALLPLEFKSYGALRKEYFEILASTSIGLDWSTHASRMKTAIATFESDRYNIDPGTDLTAKYRDLIGTISMCQQAIAYAWHYGSRAAVLCDYASAVVIRIPRDFPKTKSFRWYFMSRSKNALGDAHNNDPRKTGTVSLAIGIELWRALEGLRKDLLALSPRDLLADAMGGLTIEGDHD